MQQYTLSLLLGHIIIGAHRELKVVKLGTPPAGSALKGKLSQPGLGSGERQLRQWQFATEIFLVETLEPFLHPVDCYYHSV